MKTGDAAMGAGKTRVRSRRNPGERLKDEVYRQMFRLEAGREGATLDLAIALLRAWLASCAEAGMTESSDWLKKISPICLRMIEATQQTKDARQQLIQ